MSINALSSSVLQGLASYQAGQTAESSAKTAQTGATALDLSGAGGNSPSYLLTLGQKDLSAGLVSYSRMGTLVSKAEKALDGIENIDAGLALTGNGKVVATTHRVEVRQLAQAQTLTGSSFGSADSAITDAGSLTVQLGRLGDDGLFAAGGEGLEIQIQDPSLNGIAAAINGSDSGLKASVIEQDGQYHLQISGPGTGAGNAFRLSGMAELEFDPESPAAGGMILEDAPQDARLMVNGTLVTSASNDNVEVVDGVTLDLTQAGTISVTVPAGQKQALGGAQTLVDTVNQLLAGLSDLDGDAAISAQKSVLLAVSEELRGGSLENLGISIDDDGSLSLDKAAFGKAFSADPARVHDLLDQVAQSLSQALDGHDGLAQQARSGLATMTALLGRQQASLVDYLSGSAGGGQQDLSSVLGGGSSGGSLTSADIAALYGKSGKSSA